MIIIVFPKNIPCVSWFFPMDFMSLPHRDWPIAIAPHIRGHELPAPDAYTSTLPFAWPGKLKQLLEDEHEDLKFMFNGI